MSKEFNKEIIPHFNFSSPLTPSEFNSYTHTYEMNKQYLSRMMNLITSSQTKTKILLLGFGGFFNRFFLVLHKLNIQVV